jgi:hypothetical protein
MVGGKNTGAIEREGQSSFQWDGMKLNLSRHPHLLKREWLKGKYMNAKPDAEYSLIPPP